MQIINIKFKKLFYNNKLKMYYREIIKDNKNGGIYLIKDERDPYF